MSALRICAGVLMGALATLGLVAVGGASDTASSSGSCDLDLGESVFQLCSTCHALQPDDRPREGPNLRGFSGRKAGTADGSFDYSPVLKQSGWVWDQALLQAFLLNPRRALPGTTMTFVGLKSAEDRAAVACYLERETND